MAGNQGGDRSKQLLQLRSGAAVSDRRSSVKEPVLVLGATSAIARSTARAFAEKGYSLYLAGRDNEELERLASDFRLRYQIEVVCGVFDAEDYESHARFVEQVRSEAGGLKGVLLAFGYLG